MAEFFNVPSEEFHVIEYPGYVENLDNAINTLGGLEEIKKGFNSENLGALELKFRKNNFAHPINGEYYH